MTHSSLPAQDRSPRAAFGSARPVITGQGCALPPAFSQQEVWDGYFRQRMADHPLAEKLFLDCGITTRHGVVNPALEDVSDWGTGRRMQRYLPEARALGYEAVAKALSESGLDAADVGMLVVASCTGYATPGLDILLADDLGMPASVQRLVVGHMGCYAAVPALAAAADYVRAHARPAVVLCVELTSLHVQPRQEREEVPQMVAHALFADAAAALVIEPDADSGLEVVSTGATTAPDSARLMTWDVTDHGFRMGLSPEVPAVLARHVSGAMADLLDPYGLRVPDVGRWVVHPGGPKILDVVGEKLGLDDHEFDVSREVLDANGNCSSGTVLMVLGETRAQRAPESGQSLVAMAFGPGLTLCSALLRAV